MFTLLLLACSNDVPVQVAPPVERPVAYWVKRSDAELRDEMASSCARAVERKSSMLLVFSAPWCGDCKALRAMDGSADVKAELAHWEKVVVDVGRFDRHTALIEHFGVSSIAHQVALTPMCDKPVTEWPVLASGTFEVTSNAAGPRTPADVAGWLAAARD